MSSKNDLFGDSSSEADTDDLIAAAKSQPIATKKGTKSSSPKKAQQPDADNDSDDDDSDDEDFASPEKQTEGGGGGGGLFDSSSDEDDDDDAPKSKKKKKVTIKKKTKKLSSSTKQTKKKAPPKKKDGRTMKEKMEELAKKKRQAANGGVEDQPRRKRKKATKGGEGEEGDTKKGYESGDSYDSATFARTKEDDDFIDADDEDPEALKELYAEQHFDDERPEGYDSEEEERKKRAAASGKKKKSSGGGGVDKISLSDDEDGPSASAALKDAVRRMQRKKKEVKKLPQLEQEATDFLRKMDAAADADDESIAAKRPALKKLGMLSEVMEMLAQKDLQRVLLDLDLLMVCKRWVQPLPPDGKTLGNLTVRRRIIESLGGMTGENGINSSDLKRSGFGKVVMALFKHKSETPEMKKMLKAMIEQWSRPIFQKSGNLRDLERAQMVRGMNEMGSLVGIARQQAQQQQQASGQKSAKARGGRGGRAANEDDLAQIINTGSKNSTDIGNNRVRVPYSKGFQFSVRPADRTGDVSDKRNLVSAKAARSSMGREGDNSKDSLQKRMLNKARPVNKQSQRSANISIEGRVVK